MKISAIPEPRSQREVMLGALLVILVPLVALTGVMAGQHLPAVASAAATSSPAPHPSGTMPGMDMSVSAAPLTAEQMDSRMAQATKAFPVTTQGLGGQVMQPAVQADGTKQYELTAAITPWEVSPGRIVQAWTRSPLPTRRSFDGLANPRE